MFKLLNVLLTNKLNIYMYFVFILIHENENDI